MVLRRSTTRWTWPSDFNNSERSTVTFIAKSVHAPDDGRTAKVARQMAFRQGRPVTGPAFSLPFTGFRWRDCHQS